MNQKTKVKANKKSNKCCKEEFDIDNVNTSATNAVNKMTIYADISSSLDDPTVFASSTYLKGLSDNKLHVVINDIRLETISRRFLKKCKFCGFKKRSCFGCPSSCLAVNKICFKCGICGHFPK